MVQCRVTWGMRLFATPTYPSWLRERNVVYNSRADRSGEVVVSAERKEKKKEREEKEEGRRETVGEDLKVVSVELVEVNLSFPHVS